MQPDILIIGVLFPAIPLMMVNFGNRYSVLASLIRSLHDEVIRDNVSIGDAERFLSQISRLRHRLRLIGFIQSCAAFAFVLALAAMIATYFDYKLMASWLFFGSMTLMMASMLIFMREIQIANAALDVHLSDLALHQEWHEFLQPPKRTRAKRSTKKSAKKPKTANTGTGDTGAEKTKAEKT